MASKPAKDGKSGRSEPVCRNDPKQSGTLAMHLSPRCGAYCRTHGGPCRNGAMPNGRCRMHGGKSRGAGLNNLNAYFHGGYSAQVEAEAAPLREKANALLVETIHAQTDIAR